MSREEAMKELSYIIDEMPSMECADWIEAISMAIEALEQEPCGDAISRQAVIEKAICVPIARVVTEDKVIYRKIVFVDEIENIPPVTPAEKVNDWIPVSERYPEDGQRVLVDYCDEDAGIMLIRFNVNGYHGFKAWMPLPERYRQEVKE